MTNFVVRLELRVRLSDGSRSYLDPVLSANGKVKPLCAVGSRCDRPQAGSRSSVEVGFVVYCSLAYSDLA